ncbi:MAG: hypothetical protein U0736_04110 [Gemmataceae bacterium]
MLRSSWLLVVVLFLLAPPASAVAPPPRKPTWDPDERYTAQSLRGWTLKVHDRLLAPEHDRLRRDTLELLDSHLYQITRVVPAGPLAKLRRVPIWVELAHPQHPCMCYHVSKAWLREHHMNPNKAGAVELANCRNFLTWTRGQPWMVLHELAHAYHHQVLGFDHPGVRLCHDQAMRGKLYDSVLHIDGSRRRHYACTNPTEYFAEMTEAYFGTNDFYPFVRAELRAHDPRMYELIEQVWEIRKPGRGLKTSPQRTQRDTD